jgi:YegS/Rv2252/BmrU family lipid kinase
MADCPKTLSVLRASPSLVLVNFAAGGGRVRTYLPRIQKLFNSLEISVQFAATNSAEELESAAKYAILQGKRVLFAMGGDGTFQALVNASYGADVLLGVLPLGGGNDFAAALGIPRDPVKAADAIVRGRPRRVDLARGRTADGRTRFYVGGGGVGLDAEAARYASGGYRHFPGRIRYIAAALRALAGYKALEVQIEFPETDPIIVVAKTLLAGALNTPTYGAGLRLAPGATVDDGLLHVFLVEDLSTLGVLNLLPRLVGSGELRTSRIKRWQVKRARLTTDRPCLFHGDGEILGPTPVEIEVVHSAIQVLAPVPG